MEKPRNYSGAFFMCYFQETLNLLQYQIMQLTFDQFHIASYQAQHLPLLYKLVNENRPRLLDFFAGLASRMRNEESANAYGAVIVQQQKDKAYFPFLILNAAGEAIGLVDVKNIDWRVPKAELGYFVDQQYEGQGISSRAFGIVVDHIVKTHHFKKLLCRAHHSNTGSIRIAEKQGFQLEGTITRDYKSTDGTLVDLNYYGKCFD
jgi:RimJ/RimL family protein N-acetyltransferase